MQTRTNSLVESVCNVAVGYFVALASQLVIFPLMGLNVPIRDNVIIGLWFTVVSIARSYILRRYFSRRTENEKTV